MIIRVVALLRNTNFEKYVLVLLSKLLKGGWGVYTVGGMRGQITGLNRRVNYFPEHLKGGGFTVFRSLYDYRIL